MAAFAGINLGVDSDLGTVEYVSAHKVKIKIVGAGPNNNNIAGLTNYINFTLGTVTTYTLTATIINDAISTSTEYQLPLLNSGSLSGLSATLSATGKWVWPIAVPTDSQAWLVLTGTYTGSAPDSTTIVKIESRRDTINGK